MPKRTAGAHRFLQDDVPVVLTKKDSILLFVAVAAVNIAALHGKQWSAVLLGQDSAWLWSGAYSAASYAMVFCGAAAVVAAGASKLRGSSHLLAICGSAFLFPVLVQVVSAGHSSLILLMQIYTGASAGMIFFLRRYYERPMSLEFWDRMVGMGLKAIRFALIFYGALLALLKFISDGMKEGKEGFVSTLLYPTLILLFSFLMWIVWLIVPAWERAVQLRAKGHASSGGDEDASEDLASEASGTLPK